MIYTKESVTEILNHASAAANEAGDIWMVKTTGSINPNINGVMLDLCGFSFVEVKDKRSAFFKALKKFGFIDNAYTSTIPISYKYRSRQEWSLKEACMRAAAQVLRDHGITDIKLFSKID